VRKVSLASKSYSKRDYYQYEKWTEENNVEHLIAHGVKPQHRVLRDLPNIDPRSLPKPDLLHTLLLGMLKHLVNWIMSCLKQYHHLTEFNEAWLSVPASLEQPTPNKTNEQVKQLAGKDLCSMA
jgi:hypothetical protein